MPTPTPTSPTPPTTSHVGRYARSIETGWLGKVIAVEDHGEPMLKMIGVNQLYRTMKGGHIDDALQIGHRKQARHIDRFERLDRQARFAFADENDYTSSDRPSPVESERDSKTPERGRTGLASVSVCYRTPSS